MGLLLVTFSRAIYSQLHWRMLLLTVAPFLLSIVIWGVLLWLGLQPLMDGLRTWFDSNGWFQASGQALDWAGLDYLKPIVIPLLAMWLLLPLMILTALLFVGVFAMPSIVKHLAARNYRGLARREGGSLWGSIWVSMTAFLLFAVMWLVTLPLNVIPPFTFLVQPLLWGWLTYKVMAYDALAEHATVAERKQLVQQHRLPLFLIGVATGSMGAAPTLLWLGGAFGVIIFPLLAGVSIWLYVVVFVFSGLWFAHYSLEALARLRLAEGAQPPPPAPAAPDGSRLKDINPPPVRDALPAARPDSGSSAGQP